MADNEEPEKIWDEYDWERFLQQQDRKTERYMELLEKYIDDPNRDQIIAREMGWHHLLDEDGRDWSETVDSTFAEEMEMAGLDNGDEEEEEPAAEGAESFELHPLYQASFAVTIWIDQLFEELGDLQNHPSAVRLATQAAIASAKLAAALSDDDVDEIGMTIAYLKRALKAVTNSMEAGMQLKKEAKLGAAQCATLDHRLFQIRDGIIALMGEYRTEWRRRFGNH
jgi:hypothetical protein